MTTNFLLMVLDHILHRSACEHVHRLIEERAFFWPKIGCKKVAVAPPLGM